MKVIKETLIFFDYMLDIEGSKLYLFQNEDFYVEILDTLSLPLNYTD
jgi:hypothetical protein